MAFQFSSETVGRLLASGRNYANSFVGLLAGLGIASAAQDKGLLDGIADIYNGAVQMAHGASSVWVILSVILAPIVTPLLARWASNSARPENQAAAVKAAAVDATDPVKQEAAKVALLNAASAVPSAVVATTDLHLAAITAPAVKAAI